MMNAELAEYFKSIGITQEDIANRLGVSQQYVSALLSGKSAFGKKQAQRFQEIWGIQSSWLLTGEGDMLAKRKIPLYDDRSHSVTMIYIKPDQSRVDEANRRVIDYVSGAL